MSGNVFFAIQFSFIPDDSFPMIHSHSANSHSLV